MKLIFYILHIILFLKLTTPATTDVIDEATKKLADEIAPIMEFILGEIAAESERSKGVLADLLKETKKLVKDKLKPIEKKNNEAFLKMKKVVDDLTEKFDKQMEDNRKEADEQIQEMKKEMTDARNKFNIAAIDRMTTLEQKINDLKKQSNEQAPSEMDEIVKQLQTVWEDSNGITEEITARFKNVDDQIKGILSEIKKEKKIPIKQIDQENILNRIAVNTNKIRMNFQDNRSALKSVEKKCTELLSSRFTEPTDSLLESAPGFLELSKNHTKVEIVAKRMYNLEKKLSNAANITMQTNKKNFIKFENDLKKSTTAAKDLVDNLRSNFDLQLNDLRSTIEKNKNYNDVHLADVSNCITKFSNGTNALKSSLAKYQQYSDNIYRHYIRDYKKENMGPIVFKCE